jgi:flagella basal body P-ring formation protein FlgA
LKTFFIFLLILLSTFSHACFIKTFDKFIIPSNFSHSGHVIKETNCKTKTVKAFTDLLKSSNGLLSSRLAKRIIPKLKSIYPSRIHVIQLDHYLTSSLVEKNNWHYRKSKFIKNSKVIPLSKEENIEVVCKQCSGLGEHNLLLRVYNPIKNNSQNHWLTSELLVQTRALVSVNSLGVNHKSLKETDFIFKEVLTRSPEKIFSNMDKLKFYKLNKPKINGEYLNFTDLVPVNLVDVGRTVKVKLNNSSLSLSGKAVALQGGRIGDVIQLQNPITKKKLIGKITNFNEVMVDL